MRTSHRQYVKMLDFMETYGDLSKPSSGPRGRHFTQMKWRELTHKLNRDGTGDPRPEVKWRKVWSDYKNNCKKKCAKMKRSASGTGGSHRLSLNDLEKRVMQIIGVQAATGMVIEEAGFQQDEVETAQAQTEESVSEDPLEDFKIDWNTPDTSRQPTVTSRSPSIEPYPASPPVAQVDEERRPPPQNKTKTDDVAKLFIESDRKAREYARERDRAYDELEKERLRVRNEELRVREFEIQERVRQRDVELQLQAQWLEFMKEAMDVFVGYIEKKS